MAAARVLFDEAHSEAWTLREELAATMQPAHPADASYALAARALKDDDIAVVPHVDGPLTASTLRDCDVLVIAHPSDSKWERTTGAGSPRLSKEELDAIEAFVRDGGGLIVLGETEQEKYGNNLNDLLARFGLEVENCTVQDYEHHHNAPSWVLADLEHTSNGDAASKDNGAASVDLLARVHAACFYRAGTLALRNGGRVLARTSETASARHCPGARSRSARGPIRMRTRRRTGWPTASHILLT